MNHAISGLMNWKIVTGSIVGLMIGFALGIVVSPSWDLPAEESVVEAKERSRPRAVSAQHKPNSPGDVMADEGEVTLAAPDTFAIERGSGLSQPSQHGPLVTIPAELISTLSRAGHVRSLDQPFFPKDSELATYLQLDEVQSERIETAWEQLRDQVRALETESARLEEKPDGSLEVILPELKAQIDALGNGFRTSAAQTVGANRSEVLMATAQFDQVLGGLGAERKITIHAEETGDGGWRYHTVVDGPQGKRAYVGENLPSSLLHLAGPLQMEFEEPIDD